MGNQTQYIFDYAGLRQYLETTYLTAAQDRAREVRRAEERAWKEEAKGPKGWEIGVDGKMVSSASVGAKTVNYVQQLKQDGPKVKEKLGIVRDPATNEDHSKVEKIFDISTPHWDNEWQKRTANTDKIVRWVSDFMPRMKPLRCRPPRRHTMRLLHSPPNSGAGPDRRLFGF